MTRQDSEVDRDRLVRELMATSLELINEITEQAAFTVNSVNNNMLERKIMEFREIKEKLEGELHDPQTGMRL